MVNAQQGNVAITLKTPVTFCCELVMEVLCQLPETGKQLLIYEQQGDGTSSNKHVNAFYLSKWLSRATIILQA